MKKVRSTALSVGLAVLVLLAAGPALAVDIVVNLVAEKVNLTMPGTGEVVPMWGYRLASADPGTATVPGPTIAATTDDTLTINLTNNLNLGPGLIEPTSIVIPGQMASEVNAMVPTWNNGSTGGRTSATQRVRSFTHETLPAGVATYQWNNLNPGTYLIQSGTHPAVQIQMGLYAVLKVDDAGGGSVYGRDYVNGEGIVMLFSEIDPALHSAVATSNYGPDQAVTSTMDYDPKYFLLNGEPYYNAGDLAIPVVDGDNLVSFVNAGLQTRVPQFLGAYMTLLAEDGNQVPFAKDQSSLVLPAGKTFDVIVTAVLGPEITTVDIPIYDRRLAFSPHPVQVAMLAEKFGVFRSSPWYLDANGNGAWDPDTDTTYVNFGMAGDLPVVGEWNGAVSSRVGVFRDGTWYLDANGNGAWDPGTDTVYANFGMVGDLPVVGDWNDGAVTSAVGVFRNGTWYLDANNNGAWDPDTDTVYANFGMAGDLPVVGDWNGDGVASEIGVFRNGTWYLDTNNNGVWDPDTDTVYDNFGMAGDLPVVGDWIGDGVTQIGVFRNGTWYLDMNGNGAWNPGLDAIYSNFGLAGDIPVAGNWQ
jgi:hypothetical protein